MIVDLDCAPGEEVSRRADGVIDGGSLNKAYCVKAGRLSSKGAALRRCSGLVHPAVGIAARCRFEGLISGCWRGGGLPIMCTGKPLKSALSVIF